MCVCVRACVFMQVVGTFTVDVAKAKGSKEEGESNSVESVGFCNV